MYAVTVCFTPKSDAFEAFLPLMLENARTSLAQEPGCQQFDVCLDEARSQIFLYEIYDHKAAFEAHLDSAHFKSFAAATADMVADKTLAIFPEVLR